MSAITPVVIGNTSCAGKPFHFFPIRMTPLCHSCAHYKPGVTPSIEAAARLVPYDPVTRKSAHWACPNHRSIK